ncbi:MAG: glutathione S-transferase N-terminal domain-containing protein [Deltaproteobacteria bacterium]|nr:glutathione S-transferase N-terminal domain-containing protein [Deltaproteobacteria bacterium]MBN2673607.1 glutathione S-transferase N-terminal domain-containing protein [Deltaproteobacteria bacterium]
MVKKLVGLQSEQTYRNLFHNAPRKRADGTDAPPLRVTVYTTKTCPHCTTVKNHLKRKGIPYREVDVSRDAHAASELQRRTGQTGVPQTDINGTFVLGADISKINKLLQL